METTASNSQATRLLCASAFMNGATFQRMVLDFLSDENRAAAPELGVDVGLVAQVCKFARNRDRRYLWLFVGCLVVAAIGVSIDSSLGLVVLIVSSAAVYLRKAWKEQFTYAHLFSKSIFDPDKTREQLKAELEAENYAALPSQDQNLIVYSGFSPFVGAGVSLGGWSFVVNVDKGKEGEIGTEMTPISFQNPELYAEIENALNSLGLNGMSHRDMYFVSGNDIRNDRGILANSHGRPAQMLAGEDGPKYQVTNDRRIRHYKWICVMDWGNELCTSYFLRCTLRGSSMFVEINRYLLTPVADKYRKADTLTEGHWRKVVGLAIIAPIAGTFKAIVSPLIVFLRFQEWLGGLFDQKHRARNRLIDENPLYNYGIGNSLRELVSSDQFMHYFQKLDGDFYSKVLERAILAAIVDFLDEHNIDTSEFKERQSTILNSGIIIHGGDVTAQSLAVGSGAQAMVGKAQPETKTKFRRAAKGAAA